MTFGVGIPAQHQGVWTGASDRVPWTGLPDPRLPRAVARARRACGPSSTRLSEATGIDLVAHGTTSDAETIKDTAVAQPLIVGAGLISLRPVLGQATARPDTVRTPRRATPSVRSRQPQRPVSSIRGDAVVFVRERGRAMAEASAVTPTGMAAVLGGDPDDVLAALERHGLTAANVNGAGPDRRRRHPRADRGLRSATPRPRPASSRSRSPARSTPSTWHRPSSVLDAAGPDFDVSDPGVTPPVQRRRPAGHRRPEALARLVRQVQQPGALGPVHGDHGRASASPASSSSPPPAPSSASPSAR